MARRYVRKYKPKRGYKKFTKRRAAYRARRATGSSGRRRLNYDNRFPSNTIYSDKPVYGTGTVAPTSAPKRARNGAGDIQRLGENSSMSACYFGKSAPRNLRYLQSKAGGMKTVYSNSVGQMNTVTGQQSRQNWANLTQADLTLIKTNLDADLPTEMKCGNNNMRIMFGRLKAKLQLKNQTNHVAHITIYNVVPRKRSQTSTLDTPDEAWVKGVTDQGMADFATYPGRTPFESKEFTTMFYVIKATRLHLEPGEQHEHNFQYKWNKIWDSTSFDLATSGGFNIPGLTSHVFMSAYGSIGHASTDSGLTVSYMPVRIDHIYQAEFTCNYVGTTKKATALLGTSAITTLAPTTWNHLAASDDVEAPLTVA